MTIFKKMISLLVALILILPYTFSTVSAAEDFTMKSFDKGYVTFIFDDGKMPFTKEVAELFEEYGMPMCCAMPGGRLQKDSELHKVLLNVQSNGGEILSHGYDHKPITSEERSKNPEKNVYGKGIYTLNDIEKELGSSWKRLTNLGFNVNGIIQVGCGDDESTADYALVETVARKYYKYSNASGLSAQYQKDRTFMNWKSMRGIRDMINKAIQNKEWIILSAHGYNEISNDAPSDDTAALREILDYIESKNGEIEVVTWNYIYNTFGEYTGAKIPTDEALSFLTEEDEDSVFETSSTTSSESSDTSSVESSDTSSSETSDTSSAVSSDTSLTTSTNSHISSSVSGPVANSSAPTSSSSTTKKPEVSQVTSVTESSTDDTSSIEENTSSKQNNTSSEKVSSSSKQESVSSEQTVSETEKESTKENSEVLETVPTKKQNNLGKIIAISVAAVIALTSVAAAVIVFLKFK